MDRINALSKYLAIDGTANRSSYVYRQSFNKIISGYFLYYVIFGIVNAEGVVVIVEFDFYFSTTNSFEFNSSGVNPLPSILSIALSAFSGTLEGSITIIGGL